VSNPFDEFDDASSGNPFDEFDDAYGGSPFDDFDTRTDAEKFKSDATSPFRPDMTPIEAGVAQIKNIPQSAARFGANIITPLVHPVETAKNIGTLAKGTYHKFTDGEQEEEAAVDAVKNFFVDRYGGLENIQKTAVEDPVGFLADIAMLFTGGGAALKATGTLGKVPAITKAGQVASRVGKVLDPVTSASGVVGKMIPEKLPQKMYASAAKMTTSKKVSPAKRMAMAQTGLDEAILPTQSGLKKLTAEIDTVNNKIAEVIDDVARQGDVVPRSKILQALDDLKRDAYFSSDRKKYFGIINKIEEKIKRDYGPRVPSNAAQKLKQNIYQEVGKYYGGRAAYVTEVKKAVALGAKNVLAEKYPELAALNARDSSLISLQKAIEAAVKRIENRDLVGIGLPIKTAAGAAAGSSGGAAGSISGALAGLASGLIDTPVVKARLAIALNKARKSAGNRGPVKYTSREIGRQMSRQEEALSSSGQ